ncbi:MAG TPA: CDP-alcohol phosphatidyltransferase family protein [Pilimelia sp.]|nr:CDP-alcohol phosphatidyltransferase family protein [Pilimelia sp.]
MTWDAYAAAWAALHGGFDPRGAAPLVRGWLRLAYAIGSRLARLGVPPTAVTAAGLLLSLAVPVAAAAGAAWPLAAAGLVLLSAVADSADGAVAVVSGRTSRLGYVYDSVADRLSELCWAAALWAVGAPGWLLLACAALSWLHEYVRARATAAGMGDIGVVTTGERPTRVSAVLVGLLLAGAAGALSVDVAAGLATVGAAVWALLAAFGFGRLLVAVRASLR